MEKEQIYIIGEQFVLDELDVANVTYPKTKNTPLFCIVELANGIKLKVSIINAKTKT